MTQNLPIVKGTRDFYPEDMVLTDHIMKIWERTSTIYGFQKYDGPILETLEMYKKKSGDEIVSQLYSFNDKNGREIALRPELTPTLARLIVQKGKSIKKPIKWYSIGRFFRYERMQRGRKREFFQWNIDILGENSYTAEVEIMGAIITSMQLFGFKEQDIVLKINNRKLISAILSSIGIPENKINGIFACIDKKNKISEGELERILASAGTSQNHINKIIQILNIHDYKKLPDEIKGNIYVNKEILRIETLYSILDAFRLTDFIQLDFSIVRGLDYYTGFVFELFYKSENLRAICGGGRYDNLLSDFGSAEDLSGVGMAMGDVVLEEVLMEKRLLDITPPGLDYYIAYFKDENLLDCINIVRELRSKKLNVSYPLHSAKMNKVLAEATQYNAKYVIFLWEEELKENIIMVRDMQTKEEKRQNLYEFLKKL